MTHRRYVWALVAALAILIGVVWALLPWQWSMIDDPSLARSVQDQIEQHGFVGGLAAHVGTMFAFDRDWSLFRPLYWVYPSLIYWLPIGLAHVVRLLMLVVAIAGPVIALRRRGAEWTVVVAAGLILVSGSLSLMLGLFYVSLQELSGAALIGLGLMIRTFRARVLLWLGAAWFKSVFAWLLVGEAVADWREGARRRALVSGGLGVGTLVVAALMARRGTYTSVYLDVSTAWSAVRSNTGALLGSNVLLPVVALLGWLIVSGSRPQWSRMSLVFIIGFAGCTLQLLPWYVTGYYAGSVVFLLSLFLTSLLPLRPSTSRRRRLLALIVPTVLSLAAVSATLQYGFRSNAQWRETTECLLGAPSPLVVIDRDFPYENAWRVEDNIRLRDPQWEGRVVSEADVPIGTSPPGTLLVLTDDRALEAGVATEEVCRVPDARIVRLVPSAG